MESFERTRNRLEWRCLCCLFTLDIRPIAHVWETATGSDVAVRNGSGALFQTAASYAAQRKLVRGSRPKNYGANWKRKLCPHLMFFLPHRSHQQSSLSRSQHLPSRFHRSPALRSSSLSRDTWQTQRVATSKPRPSRSSPRSSESSFLHGHKARASPTSTSLTWMP